MLVPYQSKRYLRDLDRMQRRHKNIDKLNTVIDLLCKQEPLDPKYRDHQLTGNLKNFRECHIEPDWLLIYKIQHEELILVLTRTGTHSDMRF